MASGETFFLFKTEAKDRKKLCVEYHVNKTKKKRLGDKVNTSFNSGIVLNCTYTVYIYISYNYLSSPKKVCILQ